MFKHLLVATDGSKLSGKAVAQAIALAKPLKAKLTAFYAAAAVGPWVFVFASWP